MIPKPARVNKCPVYRVRVIYPWSEGRLEALRKAVRSASKQHLVVGKPPNQQNIERWKMFQKKVTAAIPELEEFEDCWPASVFLRILRENANRNGTRRARNRMKSNHDAVCRNSGPKLSAFVGKPLPRRMRVQIGTPTGACRQFTENVSTPNSTVRPTSGPSNTRPGPSYKPTKFQVPQRADRDNERVTHSHRPEACTESIGNGSRELPGPSRQVAQLHTRENVERMARQFGTQSSIDNSSEEQQPTINAGCIACFFCSYTPDVPAIAKAHIQVFSQNQAIIDALARLGIVNDKHLSILNHLAAWNAGPEQFLGSLTEGVLSPLYKFSLLQHFENYFLPKALTSVSRNINCWSGCPNHSHGNNDIDRVPPKLWRLLEDFGMEELAPVFSAAQVKSDDEFDLLYALDETQRLAIFAGDQFRRMRPLQRWMLKFLLMNIDI